MLFLNIFDEIKNKSFWQNFNKDFHIENQQLIEQFKSFSLTNEDSLDIKDWMSLEGYYHLKKEKTDFDTNKYASLIQSLVAANILPVFAFIYDEFWLVQLRAKALIESILGESYSLRPCLWAWHLDPNKEEAGWKPHRDGNIESLNKDLKPKVLSLWVPLTNADSYNGCMYIVPMNRENSSPEKSKGLDFNLPNLRALPASAGDMLVWNHWVIHWGSRASKRALNPRISLGFELEQKNSNILNAPLLDPNRLPSFEDRLKIIAYQIQQYTHMYKFSEPMLNFAKEILENKCLTKHQLSILL